MVMRLYFSLILYHTYSVLSRGFCKIFRIIFHFDENRQKTPVASPPAADIDSVTDGTVPRLLTPGNKACDHRFAFRYKE